MEGQQDASLGQKLEVQEGLGFRGDTKNLDTAGAVDEDDVAVVLGDVIHVPIAIGAHSLGVRLPSASHKVLSVLVIHVECAEEEVVAAVDIDAAETVVADMALFVVAAAEQCDAEDAKQDVALGSS